MGTICFPESKTNSPTADQKCLNHITFGVEIWDNTNKMSRAVAEVQAWPGNLKGLQIEQLSIGSFLAVDEQKKC